MGSTHRPTSFSLTGMMAMKSSVLCTTFPWLSIAPLGRPVVPEV